MIGKFKVVYVLLFGVLLFAWSCREDLPLIERPKVDLTLSQVVELDSIVLEAEIFGDTSEFEILKKYFIIQNSSKKIELLGIKRSGNRNKYFGSTSDLDLGSQYQIMACIDLKFGDELMKFQSEPQAIRINNIGFNTILKRTNLGLTLLTSVSGFPLGKSLKHHGYVWEIAENDLITQEFQLLNIDTEINEIESTQINDLNNSSSIFIHNLKEFMTDKIYEANIEIIDSYIGSWIHVRPYIEYKEKILFGEIISYDAGRGNWKEIDNSSQESYPNALAEAVSFEIDGVGYIGTGFKVNDAGTQFATSTFWAYYPETNEYKRLANFPGIEDGRRRHAVGFSIDGKGYVGLGYIGAGSLGSGNYDQNDKLIYKDFYEFTPDEGEGSWRRLADAPFPIFGAGSFVVGNKGYVVAGWITLEEDTNGDGTITQGLTNRVFRFEPEGGTLDSLGLPLGEWVQLERVPNNKGLVNPVAFAVNDKGYIATGVAGNGHIAEVYEFTPTNEGGHWEKKNDFLGASRQKAVSFVIYDKAYIATGSNAGFTGALSTLKDLWEYNAIQDSWTQKADISKFNMDSGTAFSIGGKGYVYGGFIAIDFSSISSNMRVYTPD